MSVATAAPTGGSPDSTRRGLNTWDSPWLNVKFLLGLAMIAVILLMAGAGPLGLTRPGRGLLRR